MSRRGVSWVLASGGRKRVKNLPPTYAGGSPTDSSGLPMIAGMAHPALQVEDVRKSFGNTPAVSGVSLAVEPGELFGLLGPNGAGKTTLLSISAGLLEPDGGSVKLKGTPFRSTDRAMRPLVGIGTQDLAVYPELTARENLAFFGKLYGMRDPDLADRVNELLAAVGLTDRADGRAGTFSCGMKRRLNLAVAVVHRPTLLLLDEPTTGVDPQSRNHIFEMVRKLNAGGMTVVYTSHYMEEVQALCRRIAIMDGGKVVACDTLDALLRMFDAGLRLTVADAPADFADRLARLPGVKRVTRTPGGFALTADAIGPLLPDVAGVCRDAGVRPAAIETSEPSLERVFLHLTGRKLRD
jgi:ABC-2 type transport system ATP-binding protein